MKVKSLFVSALFSAFCLTNARAQTTKISFESSEAYALSTINGQNGWQVWSETNQFPASKANVVNTNHTDGLQSAFVAFDSASSGSLSGIRKSVVSLTTANDYEVSLDFFGNGTPSSQFAIGIYSSPTPDFSYFSNVTALIFMASGTALYWDANSGSIGGGTLSVPNSIWHSYKVIIKKSDDTYQYFVDSNLIGSGTLGASKNINTLDFFFDNTSASVGFYVDNIKITNITANLATNEQSSVNNDISVFPNPTTDVINVKTGSAITSAEIFDLKGGLIRNYNDGKSQISISDLPKGVYLLKVKTKTTEFTKKVIKN